MGIKRTIKDSIKRYKLLKLILSFQPEKKNYSRYNYIFTILSTMVIEVGQD